MRISPISRKNFLKVNLNLKKIKKAACFTKVALILYFSLDPHQRGISVKEFSYKRSKTINPAFCTLMNYPSFPERLSYMFSKTHIKQGV